MNTFQSLIALVALIFALSVIVQAIQEFAKTLLKTKAGIMAQTIDKFMGDHVTLAQVQTALHVRGLDLTALENFKPQDFRSLLDAIPFDQKQLQGIVASADAKVDQIKDNITASYEAARAAFQKAYTTRNKWIALGLSMAVVALLNANIIILYRNVSVDQAAQQAILDKIKVINGNQSGSAASAPTQDDLEKSYKSNRDTIVKVLQSEPVLFRSDKYREDFGANWLLEILGLLLMGGLVSLGAPFWNDVLKGAMGINNALNGNGSKT